MNRKKIFHLACMNQFEDKVVIITGGSAGIGAAAVKLFIEKGAKVAAWDIKEPDKSERLGLGNKYIFQHVNVAKFEEVERASAEAVKHFGKIDILINNAGITRDASLQKMTLENWQQVIDVNLTGVFNCTKAVSAIMMQNNYGRIINTSSIVGLYGNYGQSNYAAAKAGIIGLTKTWARELGKYNITVNAVAPGFIATDMIATMPQKVVDMLREKVPLKKLGTPFDVANCYAFLASNNAQFISGAVISIDGGLTL